MLRDLHIRNFALVDDLRMAFGAGLNILTGETGAGKSIIIDALGYVLGERVTASEVVRAGTDRASVDAIFDVDESHTAVREKLREHGLDEDDGTLLMTRELSVSSGKSQSRVNGRLVPASILKEIGDMLVDVHGQHEHQALLVPDRHVDILDAWVGRDAMDARADVAGAVSHASQIRRELEELRAAARERVRTVDLYRYQLDEIRAADPQPGEEEVLHLDSVRLANAARLKSVADEAYHLVSGESRGAVDLLQAACAAVEQGAVLDPALGPAAEALRESASFAEDASREIRRYQDSIEINPERLEEISNRLDLLKGLRRKYGETVEDVLLFARDVEERLERLEHSEAREAELAVALGAAERAVVAAAERLTCLRREAAARFAARICEQLRDLGMGAVRFEASLIGQPVNARGAERIEFLISANPGEPLRSLARIASGGETSRVMLAIKSVAADSSGVPTMIFDEIDAGVGGRTANVLGDKLAALGSSAQILCITHLPQVAARAGDHFLIEKSVSGERTCVSVSRLHPDERVAEIVRMLGGAAASEAVLRHAREMLTAHAHG
ncbi:MAG: DNA repair protein RecN [Capsulimonadaceae bacterium]